MHWVQSTTLWQHFLCIGNSREAVFTGVVDAQHSKERKLFRLSLDQKQIPLAGCLKSKQLRELKTLTQATAITLCVFIGLLERPIVKNCPSIHYLSPLTLCRVVGGGAYYSWHWVRGGVASQGWQKCDAIKNLQIPENSFLLTFCALREDVSFAMATLFFPLQDYSACKLLHFEPFHCSRKHLKLITSLWD